jgi:alkylation response protein AidB-like acyl-CoA dehydrogenase
MNFDFSDEQKFLKEEVGKFLTAHCSSESVRTLVGVPGGVGYDAKLWADVIAQGWLGAAIPENYGGLGMGHIDLCGIAEEIGRVCAPIPFASTLYYFAEALLIAGSEAQKQNWLPQVASGGVIGCLAASEQPGAVCAATISAIVRDGRLTGVKLPVPDGGIADAAIVVAKENGALGLYIASLADVRREALVTVDPSRGAARLTFDDVPVERLGGAGEGGVLLDLILERAAVLTAFEQVGGADKCLTMAREFALGRYAFGRSIASYQAIKHKLADMYVKNELARSNAYYGAWALSGDKPELRRAAAAARVAACDAYWFAAKENIQTHGGMGFTWESDCHLHYRRASHLGLVGGSSREWKERLVCALESQLAA